MSELPVVDCTDCGVCCQHMGFPAFNLMSQQLHAAESIDPTSLSPSAAADRLRWLQMPVELQQEILEAMDHYQPPSGGQLDGPCIWLDPSSKLCRHHQHRPQVCRDFPVGGIGCLQWRRAALA
ncbi:YkgJ family cysteine cluster protein [Stieleria sp. TO1_6]|uniref:YkgJ family cysteine cluster protein n=1 Tax=Stieleria tagensis TaxID=2956795 RepID=UPI00209B556D|nr:YkgJ family cysteine cluster protein [Stieleria tagensis]MCO8125410.1 YkgJ family cysteine cluster protein [Stieleria tagensis]